LLLKTFRISTAVAVAQLDVAAVRQLKAVVVVVAGEAQLPSREAHRHSGAMAALVGRNL